MDVVSFISTYLYAILGILFLTGAGIIVSKTKEKTDPQLKKVAEYFGLKKTGKDRYTGFFKDKRITLELFKSGGILFLNISTEFEDLHPKKGMYFSIVLSNEKSNEFKDAFTVIGDRIPDINSSVTDLLMALKRNRYFTKKSVLMGFYHDKPEIIFTTTKSILSDINAVKEVLEIEHMLAKSFEEMEDFTKVVL